MVIPSWSLANVGLVFGFDPAGLANTYAVPVLTAAGTNPSPPDKASIDYATTERPYVLA